MPKSANSNREKWAAEVKRWRGKGEWSQAVAAHILDVGIDTYRTWEQARYAPSIEVQAALLTKMRRIKT